MNVLILEDEFLLAMMLVEEVESNGHNVLGPFAGGADALAGVADTVPDLALLNITLGHGERGTDVAVTLARDHGVPCLSVSGSEDIARQYQHV